MKAYAAEFFGTFWLVLGGCGSAVLAAAFPEVGIGLLGVSFAFGLNPQAITFSIQDCPFLTELHPIFIKLCPDRSLEDDSLFGESPLGRSKFDHLSLL